MSFFLQLLKLAICAALTNVADGQTGNVAGDWMLVAIGSNGNRLGTEAQGDLDNCPEDNCKLSDDAINELDFSVIKLEPENPDEDSPVTYFDFTGRTFDSALVVEPCSTPWTLDEQQSLAGAFDGVETCCLYDVCNFGRGHCTSTVKASYGYKAFGGCESGPIPGTSGVASGVTRIYVWTAAPSAQNDNADSLAAWEYVLIGFGVLVFCCCCAGIGHFALDSDNISGALSFAIAAVSLGISILFTITNEENSYKTAPLMVTFGGVELCMAIMKLSIGVSEINKKSETQRANEEQNKANRATATANSDRQNYENTSWFTTIITFGIVSGNRRDAAERSAAAAAEQEQQASEAQEAADVATRPYFIVMTLTNAAVADCVFDIVNGSIILAFPFADDNEGTYDLVLLVFCAWFGFAEAVGDVVLFVLGEILGKAEDPSHASTSIVVWTTRSVCIITAVELVLASVWIRRHWGDYFFSYIVLGVYLLLFFVNFRLSVLRKEIAVCSRVCCLIALGLLFACPLLALFVFAVLVEQV